jgi:ribonucleotide reductase alpha subunit
VKRGVRNAYFTAYMPTATTSNVVGQNECFEPFTSNIYTRQTLAGEFFIVNRHLMAELTELGLWDEQMRREIIAAGGSVQGVDRIPADVRRRYRTARELHPSLTIRMAKAMAPFVCQSMSMNLFLDGPDLPKILRFLFEAWRAGLKTGMYYCHTKPAAGSQKTSVRDTKAASAAPAAAPATPTAAPAPASAAALASFKEAATSAVVNALYGGPPGSPAALFLGELQSQCKPGCDSCGV